MPTAGAAVLGSRAAVVAVTGHQQRNRSVQPVAEILRCACPTTRLQETTTITISPAFFAAVEHYDPRYGGTVLLPPGSAPPGPFMVEGKELPTAAASESVEKTLRGVFTAFDIPIEQRSTLRHAVLEALTKITGTLAASEAPDTASIAAEKMPKKEKKEEKQQKKKAEPRKQTTA